MTLIPSDSKVFAWSVTDPAYPKCAVDAKIPIRVTRNAPNLRGGRPPLSESQRILLK
jgi:hypothetical protein